MDSVRINSIKGSVHKLFTTLDQSLQNSKLFFLKIKSGYNLVHSSTEYLIFLID